MRVGTAPKYSKARAWPSGNASVVSAGNAMTKQSSECGISIARKCAFCSTPAMITRASPKSRARFPHLQPSDYYCGVFDFLPGLLANNEMAQRSNPSLSKPVEQHSLHKTADRKSTRL